MMNKQGVFNIVQLRGFDHNSIEQLKKNLIRYNIKKQDFLVLSDLKKSLIYQFARATCELKDFNIQEFSDNEYKAEESGLIEMLNQENPKIYDLWKKVEHKVNFTFVELREFSRKKQVIDKVFFNELNFTSYNQILMLLNFEQIIDSVVTDIYFNLLSKIIRQLARIIESYMQIGHDKALFLQALEKISTSSRNEDWAKIKIEELIIKRIVKRQQESVVILDAKNQIFLVNGLILSRLTERSLEESISTLRDEPSQIYDKIHPLKLKADLGSPISYCIAYDIHKRLEKTDNLRRQQVLERKITEEVEEEVKRKEIQEKQKQSTLNWIERRITSSLMRVRSGINPTHLYWQDRDTKILTDNIKLHGELGGEVFERF